MELPKGGALLDDAAEFRTIGGNVVLGASPFCLRGIGAARNCAQAVGEGHNQGSGGDAADHDRAQAMAHEP